MKTHLLHACAFLALSLPATAEIIGVETFDYPNENVASQNGGVFWDYKNTAPAGRSGTASTWDVLTNTPTFNAGQLVTSGNAVAKREYNGFSESDGAISAANVAKTVYYRVNVTTGPVVSPRDYFGISSVNASTEVFYFGKRGVSPNWAVEEVGVVNATTKANPTHRARLS